MDGTISCDAWSSSPMTQRAQSASIASSRRPYSSAARPKNRLSPSVQSMESRERLESLRPPSRRARPPRPCACGPVPVRSRRAGTRAAAQARETADRPRGWPPTAQFGAAGRRDPVFLAAAGPDVGHLDEPGVGELVELAVELALGRGPDVGHRLLERLQQVVPAAGLLGQQPQRRHPQTHQPIVPPLLTCHY